MSTRKRGLGRGLDSLLGVQEAVAESHQTSVAEMSESDADQLLHLNISDIQPGRYQPRKHIDDAQIEELAASINAQGLMQPIVVRAIDNNRYEIIAGERRWRACQKAGLSLMPALVKEVPDEAAIAMALIENIQRENLNPMEEAVALLRLKQEFELTHDEVAKAVGKSRSTVTNLLRLTNLSEPVRSMVERGDLEMGHARALLPLESALQLEAAKEVVEKELSVRQTESLVKMVQTPKKVKKTTTIEKSADIKKLELALSDQLGTQVELDQGRHGKGKIVISYASLDILDGILNKINN